MIWTCTIPDYDLISPNAMMRMHYRVRMKEHEKLVDLLKAFGDEVVPFDVPVDIKVVREYGHRKRRMDPDNLYGSCKLLLDAIRQPSPRSKKASLDLIADDSDAHIQSLSVSQEKSTDKTTRVRVVVESETEFQ